MWKKVGCLNGVLGRFQQYFSHITETAYTVYVFPGFHQYQAGAQKCLAQENFHKNQEDPVWLEPRIKSQTLYHRATQDLFEGKGESFSYHNFLPPIQDKQHHLRQDLCNGKLQFPLYYTVKIAIHVIKNDYYCTTFTDSLFPSLNYHLLI